MFYNKADGISEKTANATIHFSQGTCDPSDKLGDQLIGYTI